MTPVDLCYPKLRAVDVQPTVQGGRPGVLLRDPLQLSDSVLIVPQPLHLALALCDGTREDAAALSVSLAVRYGVRLATAVISQLLAALDEAVLLDNERYARACAEALEAYRQAPCRPPASAGLSYPAEADELRRQLDGYLAAASNAPPQTTSVRGLVCPHIDYARGGPVYAQAWWQAAGAAWEADLAVILGTDHFGEHPLTLTRQHYATPFGVLPTACDVVDALAASIGEGAAFAGELYHRSEYSIELAAVWLHHVRQGTPCELVPILCGPSLAQAGQEAEASQALASPASQSRLTLESRLTEALAAAARGRRVLVVAAADLAHAGPAFGGRPLDLAARARLQADDDALIAPICAGDADGFLDEIRRVDNRNHVCGISPIYAALRLLQPVQGDLVAYDRCPADGPGTSLVSICGVVFH